MDDVAGEGRPLRRIRANQEVGTCPIGRADLHADGPAAPLGRSHVAGDALPAPAKGEARLSTSERRGLAMAVVGHLVLFALLSARLSQTPPPPVPGSPMTVTIVDPGIPTNGDPRGDDAPPRPQAEASEAESDPAPSPETETPTAEAPVTASESDVPAPTPDPVTKPAPPRTADRPAEATSPTPPSTRPAIIRQQPSEQVGTGELAVGASTHGDAKGLDSRLSAVVGQAVASRMRACWTPPSSGVPLDSGSRLVVRYAPDGSFQGVASIIRLVDQREVPVTEPNAWEASATDALRRCSPLGLAKVLYPYWREVEIQLYGAPTRRS
jgi:hypothetical protein